MRRAWLVAVVVFGLWACSGSDTVRPNLDAGTEDSGTEDSGTEDSGSSRCEDGGCCKTVLDCRDELYCNGDEACDPTNANADDRGCVAGTPVVCSEDEIACSTVVCNEADNRCAPHGPDSDNDGSFDATCLDEIGEPLGDDCDDNDAARFRGNTEVCDAAMIDEDCDPTTFGTRDRDSDGALDSACCNLQVDGELTCGNDCNDLVDSIRPTATEICDYVDNDCDDLTDEGVSVMLYTDSDRDGHGDANAIPSTVCAGMLGYAANHDDCDDSSDNANPGLVESCDQVDNDCDNLVDEACN